MPDFGYPPFIPLVHHRLVADGTAMANGVAQTFVVPVHGLRYVTIRGKTATSNATLAFAFLRPDGQTAYATGNPSNVTLTAGTENDSGEITCGGQNRLKVTLTPAGDGTITFLDCYGL